ncbi:hypothetical protein [Streptomyces sp. NPDC047706]|uniref:hypothetical protein n=1 Tax=Streptomyces sp. NPDC047706 TaxID=3365486 RepID=UPI003718F854
MAEEPRLNDVRLGPDGSLEYFDGAQWRDYPDIPDDEEAPPLAVSRDEERWPDTGNRGYDGPRPKGGTPDDDRPAPDTGSRGHDGPGPDTGSRGHDGPEPSTGSGEGDRPGPDLAGSGDGDRPDTGGREGGRGRWRGGLRGDGGAT